MASILAAVVRAVDLRDAAAARDRAARRRAVRRARRRAGQDRCSRTSPTRSCSCSSAASCSRARWHSTASIAASRCRSSRSAGSALSPARMLAGLGFVTAVISMWVSNTATTAMMMPIALGILAALHRDRAARGGSADGRPPVAVRDRHDADGLLRRVHRRHRHARRLAAQPDRHRRDSKCRRRRHQLLHVDGRRRADADRRWRSCCSCCCTGCIPSTPDAGRGAASRSGRDMRTHVEQREEPARVVDARSGQHARRVRLRGRAVDDAGRARGARARRLAGQRLARGADARSRRRRWSRRCCCSCCPCACARASSR